jgi:hypothetical protein
MLARGDYTNTELDAMLAICYALTLQSGYMADGHADFITMIRGCALVTQQIFANSSSSTAFRLDQTEHLQDMLGKLQTVIGPDPLLLQEGITHLEMFDRLLEADSHRSFHRSLLQTLLDLQRSGVEAYTSFQNVYSVFFTMDEPAFQTFIASDNFRTHILFLYFAAVLVLMQPCLSQEIPSRLSMYEMFSCTNKWLDSLYERLPIEMRGYIKWPFGVIKAFQQNYRAFGSDVSGLIAWVLASASDEKAVQVELATVEKIGFDQGNIIE